MCSTDHALWTAPGSSRRCPLVWAAARQVNWFHMDEELASLFDDPPSQVHPLPSAAARAHARAHGGAVIAVRRRPCDLPHHLSRQVIGPRGIRSARMEWIDVNRISEPRYASLYASHRVWMEAIKARAVPHVEARCTRVITHRADVPDELVPWELPHPSYAPSYVPPAYAVRGGAPAFFEDEDVGGGVPSPRTLGLFRSHDPQVLRARGTYETRGQSPPSQT